MKQDICAIDIDGVLSDYPQCWIDFVNTETRCKFFDLNTMKSLLSYSEYKELKHQYRSGDYKLGLPLKPGAASFVHELREAFGYMVVILTSRPFDDYPDLRIKTKQWLDDSGIEYDDLLHSRNKHLEIFVQYPSTNFIVEDNLSFAERIAAFGYHVFLMDNSYNRYKKVQGSVITRVKSFEEILLKVENGGY